jgi:hypothetical protein
MAYNKNEKTLAADVKISLLDAFEKQWKSRGQVQKRAVAAALHLWISLPKDLQARLISQELGENDFLSLVRQIVDEHIQLNCPALSKKGSEKDKYSQHTSKLDF